MQQSPHASPLERTSDADLVDMAAIARELADLAPFETLQYTAGGRFRERRFRVPINAQVIERVLAPFDLEHYRITGARFAVDDDMMLLHVVERDRPEPQLIESPTHRAKGR